MTGERQWQLSPDDDGFHLSTPSPSWVEGSFFVFTVPGRDLAGWIYHQTRPHAGLASGGCWIWDRPVVTYDEAAYYAYAEAQEVRVARPGELHDFGWPDGTRVRTLTPLRAYQVEYAPLALSLTYTADADPWVTTTEWDTRGRPVAARLDQPCLVRGSLVLDGERIEVDGPGFRDHSWGVRRAPSTGLSYDEDALRRPLTAPPVYYWAHSSTGDGLFVMGSRAGYLLRAGRRAGLRELRERVDRDPATGIVRALHVAGSDTDGRPFEASGRSISTLLRPSLSGTARITLAAWEIDGAACDGEFQDVWPVAQWAGSRRLAARARPSI